MTESGAQSRPLSLSGLLGWSLMVCCVAALLVAFPVSLISTPDKNKFDGWQWAQLIVSGGALVWVTVALAGLWVLRLLRGAASLRDTVPLDVRGIDQAGAALELAGVELRSRGDPSAVQDHDGPLQSSPVAFYAWNSREGLGRFVVFPALFWRRLSSHSEPLKAVLAHEVAHFKQRDIILVHAARDVAMVALIVLGVSILLSLITSVRADMAREGFELAALQASLVGRSFLVACLFATIGAIPLLRRIEVWREALADRYAEDVCGARALELASAIIEARPIDGREAQGKPTHEYRAKSFSLTLPYVFTAALLLSVLAGYLVANFLSASAALKGMGPLGSIPVPQMTALLSALLAIGAPLLLLLPTFFEQGTRIELRPAAVRGLVFCIGWTIGWLLSQTMPLLLASVAMPEGYDYVFKHYPGRLALAETVGTLSSSASAVLLAIVTGVLAARAGRLWLAAIPPGVWIAACAYEQTSFAEAMGALAVLMTLATIGLLVFLGVATPVRVAGATAPMVALLGLALVSWSGLGEMNHITHTLTAGAQASESKGDTTQAVERYRKAAAYSRFHAKPHAALAQALFDVKDFPGAIAAFERSASVPYAHAWLDVFLAKVHAAELLLASRSSADLDRANQYLREAERMWRANSRLPKKSVASMLYNLACVARLRGAPPEFSLARLLESANLDRVLVGHALDDEDLRSLRLNVAPVPEDAALRLLLRQRPLNAPKVEKLVYDKQITVQQLTAIVAALGRSAVNGAADGVPPPN